jgi:hypothetical protein
MLDWLQANWMWIALGVAVLMKVLNTITKHFDEYKGVKRWCLFLVDLLDVVKSTPPPVKKP